MASGYLEAPSLGAIVQADEQTRFRVWAPSVKQIAVKVVGDIRRPFRMHPSGGGYYEASLSGVGPGSLYFYRINDAVDRPDPASRFQPHGVHGPSQVTDVGFPWTDAAWPGLAWNDYVIYEAHVGTFTPEATFRAMTKHLDELVHLGVTALELMPVAQFPGDRNWGYDGVHPYAPQNTYGGPEELKRLIDACHARGLAVVLDVVYNHFGPEGNYLAEFAPYFTERHRTPWGAAINFDGPDSDPVREFFIGNALYWISEFHIDAFRLDATHAIFDQSARPFLRELADAVRAYGERLGRRVFTIAENSANDPRIVRAGQLGGFGIDAQISDDFQRSMHALLTGERRGCYGDFGNPSQFAKAYAAGFALTGQHSIYRRRRHGSDAAEVPADRFVAYTQNHDTVGNRPGGERLGQLVGFEELKLAAAATILSPSIPMLFMGEEYDDPAPFHYFINHLDRRLAEAVRQGRLQEFTAFDWQSSPPDPQARKTFERSRLSRFLANTGRHGVLRSFYRELLQFRKKWPAIREPDRQSGQVTILENEQVVIAQRRTEATAIWICFHFGSQSVNLAPHLPTSDSRTILLDSASHLWGGPSDEEYPARSTSGPTIVSPKSCVLMASE